VLDADLKSDPTPIHIVKLGYHFMYEDSQGRAEALFFKAKLGETISPCGVLCRLGDLPLIHLDLSDEPNQERDADVALPAFGGVPLSFGL
jgi:hypothetical protein